MSTGPDRFVVRGGREPLSGEARVPGDKSIGHRAVMFAALADGRSRIRGLSGGEDNRSTVRAFRSLGIAITDEGGELIVDGRGLDGLLASATPIDCGNSGTTMRLLCGVLAGRPFSSQLVGDQYLHARPMSRVARPLQAMGARIDGAKREGKPDDLYPPLVISATAERLRGIDWRSPIASAQVKSAVILAALSAEGATRFVEPAPSRDHTERMLRAMGAPLVVDRDAILIDPAGWDRHLAPRDLVVPGDLSSAAFLLGAALLVPGSDVIVRGVGVNPTRTGALDALRAMGADIATLDERDEGGEPVADLRARGSRLYAARIDGELAVRAIDELPLLAALAAHADGETVIADAAELRVKESDRIAAMAAALSALGVAVEERPDGLVIRGGPVRGGTVDSRGDHRIAMATAVCALAGSGETIIEDTHNVATSFPSFAPSLRALGAIIDG